MRLIFTFFFLWCAVHTLAQKRYQLDSLTDEQVEYEFFYKTKIQLEFASSNALLTQGTSVNVTGIQLGVQYKHHYKFGITFLNSERYLLDNTEDVGIKYESSQLFGLGAYFEYVILENYRWYLSTPFTIANAWIIHTPYDYEDNPIVVRRYDTPDFPFASIGASGGYSILYWLAIGGGIGYRKSFVDDAEVNKVLSTPYYNIGVKFRFGRFMKTLMQPDHVLKMKSVYFRGRNRAKSDKFDAKYFELLRKKEQKLKKKDERKAAAN